MQREPTIPQIFRIIQHIISFKLVDMHKKSKSNISWKKGVNPETEDRVQYLKLSSQEKWDYLMTLILATYPSETVSFDKRQIEWT